MKNKSIIASSVAMCVIILVAIISVSVAWFGDVLQTGDKIIIDSERPKGTATILKESSSNSAEKGDTLVPAIIKKGWLLGDAEDTYKNLGVLDENNKDTTPDLSDGTKPLSALAKKVTVVICYQYIGAPDEGVDGNGNPIQTKKVQMLFKGIFNQNPLDGEGKPIVPIPKNYLVEEFDYTMKTVLPKRDENGKVVKDENGLIIIQKDNDGEYIEDGDVEEIFIEDTNTMTINLHPGNEYFMAVDVNFKHIDEQTDITLLNTVLYMQFVIGII